MGPENRSSEKIRDTAFDKDLSDLREFVDGKKDIFALNNVVENILNQIRQLKESKSLSVEAEIRYSELIKQAWTKYLNNEFQEIENRDSSFNIFVAFENARESIRFARLAGVEAGPYLNKLAELREYYLKKYPMLLEDSSGESLRYYQNIERYLDEHFDPKRQSEIINLKRWFGVDRNNNSIVKDVVNILRQDSCWSEVKVGPNEPKEITYITLTYK